MDDLEPKKQGKSARTRSSILAAARELFAERGYERTSVRDIAGRAAIDPALVIRYFGSKDELFVRATEFDVALPDLPAAAPGEIGATLVRHFLDVWEGPCGESFVVLLRSAASNDYAAGRMREVFAAQVLPALAAAGGQAGAATRAGLVSSQLLGLALARYVLRFPPVVAMTADEIVREVGPSIQRYAVGG